jgi:hypothetical protein
MWIQVAFSFYTSIPLPFQNLLQSFSPFATPMKAAEVMDLFNPSQFTLVI